MKHLVRFILTFCVMAGEPAIHAASMLPVQQFQAFGADPAWESANNRAGPVPCTRTVTQDFRYRSSSANAGGVAGEMGGRVNRAPRPSYYAKVIAPKTLNDPLTASGRVLSHPGAFLKSTHSIPMKHQRSPLPLLFTILLATIAGLRAADAPRLKTETFDRDPGWDAHHNRIPPTNAPKVTQDFGYSATHHAGRGAGEIGGRIQRSTTPAMYAAPLSPVKTLEDRFTASGSFAVTASQPGGGLFFGFYNSQQPGGSGRPLGSLGMDMDFEGKGGRLAVRMRTDGNKGCGTFTTPYLPGKFRPTPLKNDGTRYHWTLAYDPQGAGGHGQFTYTLRSDTHTTEDYGTLPEASQREAHARFPYTTTFTVDVTPGLKKEGATFDRFGFINGMKFGGSATVFFDDVKIDGRAHDFAQDPGWIAVGNRTTYEDREVTGAHDFGFSEKTNHAGGAPGEIGGGLWRSGDYGYYADRVGPFDLEQRLEARGKVKLVTAGPDSDMHLGWFSSASKDRSPDEAGNFIGIHVGGPTRIGHYFIPQFATAKPTKGKVDQGPVLTPGRIFDWSFVYDPAANGGHGELRVTLGAESVTLALKPGQKKEGATLDRFGLFTSQAGGQMVKIFLDDLHYTAASH